VKRRLFNLLAAVSAVLCLATGVMWLRSKGAGDTWAWSAVHGRYGCIWSAGGSVSLEIADNCPFAQDLQHFRCDRFYVYGLAESIRMDDDDHGRPPQPRYVRAVDGREWMSPTKYEGRIIGFGFPTVPGAIYRAPYAAIVAFLAVPLVSWLAWSVAEHRRTLRRLRDRRCPACGYDLRASKDRCPECATAIPGGAQ